MKKTALVCMFILGVAFSYAQKFVVPTIHEGIDKSEYFQYAKEFLTCQEWLENNHPSAPLRKKVNAYALWWITGTPDVKMELNTDIVKIKDPNLMLLFLGGWSKEAIMHNYETTTLEGNLAGLRTVINYYKKYRKDLDMDKEIEKYLRMESKGTLEDYVRQALNQ